MMKRWQKHQREGEIEKIKKDYCKAFFLTRKKKLIFSYQRILTGFILETTIGKRLLWKL